MGVSKHGIGFRADFTKSGYRHKSPVFDTRAEAKEWETIRRGNIATGDWVAANEATTAQPTVKHVLEWYGKEITPKRVREPHRELSKITVICAYDISKTCINELNNKRLLSFIKKRRKTVKLRKGVKKPISRKTIKGELNLMSKAISAAIFEEEIEAGGILYKITINANPVDTTNLLKHSSIENDAEKRTAIDLDIQKALISAAQNYCDEVYNFIRLAIATGQRRGELLEQDWNTIHIKDKYLISKNKAPRSQPEKATREVPLSPTARKILNEMEPKKGLLFPVLGKEVDKINDAITLICSDNALPHITPHQLRHTCETNNQLAGVEREKRDLLMGHVTQGMAAVYSHAKPRDFADEFV